MSGRYCGRTKADFMPDLILGQDWLRPVHHLPGRPFGAWTPDRSSIVGRLARNAHAMPESPFLSQIGTDPRTVTYVQAHRKVRQWAALLGAAGLTRGDRVAVLGRNSIDFALAVLAI